MTFGQLKKALTKHYEDFLESGKTLDKYSKIANKINK